MKIVGNTVGTTRPRANLMQPDPQMGDYVHGRNEFLDEGLGDYATKEYVKNKIAEAELEGSEVDLSGYAQKSELPTKVSQLQNDVGYLTQHQDLSAYATKAEQAEAFAEAKKAGTDAQVSIKSHSDSKANPHNVTAEQAGARPSDWLPTPSEIGAGVAPKRLWSKTEGWNSGEITVPDTDKYTGFQISMSGQGTTILALKSGIHIRGMGGYTTADGAVTTYHFTATFSGNVWSFVGCNAFNHKPNDNHSTLTQRTVTEIRGLF